MKNSAVAGNVEYFKNIAELFDNKEQREDLYHNYGYLVIIATQHGHRNYLEKLLQINFNSNEANKNNSSALHYAARYILMLIL